MSRGKGMLFALVALTAMSAVLAAPVTAASTSDPVAATDERAPEDVSNVTAFPGVSGVEISWELSPSDFVRQSPTGSDFTSGGSFANVNDVAGYVIYRDGEEIGLVEAGETTFVDLTAVGTSIVYTVTAGDAEGNESPGVEVIASLGPPPAAVITLPDGDYGIVDVDELVIQSINVVNDAVEEDANLTVTITVEGDGLSSSDDVVILEPGTETDIDIAFDAAEVLNLNGIYEGSVTIRTNDPDNVETVYLTVAEIVDGIGLPEISIAPATVAFGGQVIDASYTRILTITNAGGPTLEGTVAIAGDAAFSISGDGTYSLGAGEADEVTVTFAPTDSVNYSATITVTSNDDNEATTDVDVTGRGTGTPEGPEVIEAVVTKATLTFDSTIDTADAAAVDSFEADLIAALAELLGIDASRITINSVVPGSIIVNFTIAQTKVDEAEPTAAEALTALQTAIADTATSNAVTAIAPVTAIADETETVVLVPVDDDGNAVVGWFTKGANGAQVGFDDFFAFADKFGTSDTDDNWDPAFDISSTSGDPDGTVNFDDFFAFADNFGKIVANADAIIAALQ